MSGCAPMRNENGQRQVRRTCDRRWPDVPPGPLQNMMRRGHSLWQVRCTLTDARRFSQIILILSVFICVDQLFLRHLRSILGTAMRKLAIFLTAILAAFLLPYWLGLQISAIRRDYFRMVYAGVMLIAVTGVILLWGDESRGASRTPILIKLALYTGALWLIHPLRPFALSFYPLALMLPVILGLLLLFSRNSSAPGWLRIDTLQRWTVAGMLFLLANGIVLAATVILSPSAVPDAGAPDAQVEQMLEQDQDDRLTGRILLVPSRDDQRVARVEALVSQGALITPKAWFAAAFILQHGRCPRHFEMAYHLASRANAAGYENAAWLMQAAYDRWQLSLGKAQRYDSQPNFQPGAGSCPTPAP